VGVEERDETPTQAYGTVRRGGARTRDAEIRVVAKCAETYSSIGAIISANLFRARFSRDFTVPSVTPVISEISS